MNDQWAAENLKAIRTLMERAAIYRRALAPVMSVTGAVGTVAAVGGWKAGIVTPGGFILYWLCVALVAMAASVLLIRRQALQQAEPFWSPPTRRVSGAMAPPLLAGLAIGLIAAVAALRVPEAAPDHYANVRLPLIWVILYGCAVHAAGFFMRRGIRVFGGILVCAGCLGFLVLTPATIPGLADSGYLIMGVVFGLLHLLYGLYLFATEKSSGAA